MLQHPYGIENADGVSLDKTGGCSNLSQDARLLESSVVNYRFRALLPRFVRSRPVLQGGVPR